MRAYILVLSLASFCAFGADDHPTAGLVYNTKEWSSLFYECTLKTPESLECDFTQVSVRKKMTAVKLEDEVSRAAKEKLEVLSAEQCENSTKYIAAVEGRAAMPKEFLQPKSDSERADTLKLMKALQAHCAKPSLETQSAFVRAASEPETRTCTVSSNHFQQSFQPLAGSSAAHKTWVVRSSPTGECGVVRLDRFELDNPDWAKGINFWRYVSRKAVTNPQAQDFLVQCKDLDEATYSYTWNVGEAKHATGCEYTEFSVF